MQVPCQLKKASGIKAFRRLRTRPNVSIKARFATVLLCNTCIETIHPFATGRGETRRPNRIPPSPVELAGSRAHQSGANRRFRPVSGLFPCIFDPLNLPLASPSLPAPCLVSTQARSTRCGNGYANIVPGSGPTNNVVGHPLDGRTNVGRCAGGQRQPAGMPKPALRFAEG